MSLVIHAAIITDGFKLALFAADGPSQYFDAYADSLLEGRLDVDPYHIGNEAFLIEDRTYGYWGLTPALFRIVLHAMFPQHWGHWARVLMLFSLVVALISTHVLVVSLRPAKRALTRNDARGLHACLLLAVGLGSSALFLPSRANVYHEATAMAGAFALASYAALASYMSRPSLLRIALVVALSALTLHARVVAGLGVLLSLCVVMLWALLPRLRASRLQRPGPQEAQHAGWTHAVCIGLGISAVAGSHVLINWLKFGRLVSLPIELNLQSTPERLAHTGGHMLSLAHFLANAYNHLCPWGLRVLRGSSFLGPVPPEDLLTTAGMDYDWREPIVSLVAASPALVALAAWGLVSSVRSGWQRWVLMVGAAASATVPLLYFAIAQRYAHDMFSLLVVLAAFGVAHAEQLPRQRSLVAGVGVLTVWSALCWWQIGANYSVWAAEMRISPVRADLIVPAYEREVRLHPDNLTVLSELAQIHFTARRLEAARSYASRALAIDEFHIPSLLLLATLDGLTNPTESVRLLRRAATHAPEVAAVQAVLGRSLLRNGQASEAIVHLQEAVRLSPEDPLPRRLLEGARAVNRAQP